MLTLVINYLGLRGGGRGEEEIGCSYRFVNWVHHKDR